MFLPLGPLLAYATPTLPTAVSKAREQTQPLPQHVTLLERQERYVAYSHAVNDLDEDATVLELQQGLHRVSHMQAIHLRQSKEPGENILSARSTGVRSFPQKLTILC